MFEKLIRKLGYWAVENLSHSDAHNALEPVPDPARAGADYSAGHIDALLDVLHLMGHNTFAEVDENDLGETIYINITIDGTDLVSDGRVNPSARDWLIAANQKED